VSVVSEIQFRPYRSSDSDAILTLGERALIDAGIDPADIPGREDLLDVKGSYDDVGGGFVVGIVETPPASLPTELQTEDGWLVAMGGFLPNEHGYEDERTVPGAVELHRMRVAPACQGEGYGVKLLQELETRIAAADFPLILATTSEKQQRALDFYPAQGYRTVDSSNRNGYTLVHFEKPVDELSEVS